MFVLTGVLFILTGMVLGLYMGSHQDYTLRPVHAHLNLLGFTLMMLFGFAYHIWPAMKDGKLALVHYVLHVIGTAGSMALLVKVLLDPPSGATFGPFMDGLAVMTTIGVLIFTYLFFTRAKN